MKKVKLFFRNLRMDYINTPKFQRKAKRDCYYRAMGHVLSYLWSIITAPVVYPIWYKNRQKIEMMWVRYKLYGKEINRFWYWVWTYGDANDPLRWGCMPKTYRDGRNTFKNRWFFSAIRNPLFTYNSIHYISKRIVEEEYSIDTRNFDVMIPSYGIGDSLEGILFKWFYANDGTMYFIYEDSTPDSIFYFGWVGLRDLSKSETKKGRFEMAFRVKK